MHLASLDKELVALANFAYGDLGYHATVFPEAHAPESTQLGVCGVHPQSTYSEQVPSDQGECAHMQQGRPLKPSLSDDGRVCVCYKPHKSYDAAIKWRSSPKAFDQLQAEWEQRQLPTYQLTNLPTMAPGRGL